MKVDRRITLISLAAAVVVGMSGCDGGGDHHPSKGKLPAWTRKDGNMTTLQDVRDAASLAYASTIIGAEGGLWLALRSGLSLEKHTSLAKVAKLFATSGRSIDIGKVQKRLDTMDECKEVDEVDDCSFGGTVHWKRTCEGDENSSMIDNVVTFDQCNDTDDLVDGTLEFLAYGIDAFSNKDEKEDDNVSLDGSLSIKQVREKKEEYEDDDYYLVETYSLTAKGENFVSSWKSSDDDEAMDLNISASVDLGWETSEIAPTVDADEKEVLSSAGNGDVDLYWQDENGEPLYDLQFKMVDFKTDGIWTDVDHKKARTQSYYSSMDVAVDGYVGLSGMERESADENMTDLSFLALYADGYRWKGQAEERSGVRAEGDGGWEENITVSGKLGMPCLDGVVEYKSADVVYDLDEDQGLPFPRQGSLSLKGDKEATMNFHDGNATVILYDETPKEFDNLKEFLEGGCAWKFVPAAP